MHVVLLGDSIFDNGVYVPNGLPLHRQLGQELPAGALVSLLAVDGDITADVPAQLEGVPRDRTHLVVSCGGNDALAHLPVLGESLPSVAAVLQRFAEIRREFRKNYRSMLEQVTAFGCPVIVCTVYDQVPDIGEVERAALAMFNEIILEEAQYRSTGIIDLRLVCREVADYSELSPIEPSEAGGRKIAKAIRAAILGDNTHRVVPVYGGAHAAYAW